MDTKICNFCGIEYGVVRYDNARGMCDTCQNYWNRESSKVALQCLRSRRHGLPATLTIHEWIRILVRFRWTCVYCQSAPYEAIEHFIPVIKGGGTTRFNCVPACRKCNKLKHQLHPDDVTAIPQEALARVSSYLRSR